MAEPARRGCNAHHPSLSFMNPKTTHPESENPRLESNRRRLERTLREMLRGSSGPHPREVATVLPGGVSLPYRRIIE